MPSTNEPSELCRMPRGHVCWSRCDLVADEHYLASEVPPLDDKCVHRIWKGVECADCPMIDALESRWIVRYKSRVITGGWEESLFYQEENARGFARDAGDGVTVVEYRSVATPSSEVESALVELREMWPNGSFHISFSNGLPRCTVMILRERHHSVRHPTVDADTLASAMASIRAWREKEKNGKA